MLNSLQREQPPPRSLFPAHTASPHLWQLATLATHLATPPAETSWKPVLHAVHTLDVHVLQLKGRKQVCMVQSGCRAGLKAQSE